MTAARARRHVPQDPARSPGTARVTRSMVPVSRPPDPASTLRQTAFDLTAPLISGFEYAKSFGELARLVSTRVASGCVLDFYDSGELRRIACAPDPRRRDLAVSLTPLVTQVLRRGRSVSASALGGELAGKTRTATGERARRKVGMDWVVCVPLAAPRGVLGTMTFMGLSSTHAEIPLALAEELGRRAGASLDNARLYHDATSALEVRERVLAMVSHDLRNPLGVILMGASRMAEQTPSHDRRAAGRREVDAILRSARRMRSLITDLLDLSVVDTGGLVLRPAEVNVRALVYDLVADLELQASAGGISLAVEVSADVAMAWADPDRIAQVIMNLAGNALKFTPRGGRLRVGARLVGPAEIEVSVSDDGPGIRPDDLPRIFDRFWQAPETAAKGTGLGLAICKGIVEQSGGRIRAESRLGRGTTMTFTLPTALVHSAP